MNLFFIIYQQLEFNNYFSVAKELKKKNKEINIFFVFTNKEKFKLITKNKEISNFLTKNFKLIILKSSNKSLMQKIYTLLNLINECSNRAFPPTLVKGLGIFELNLLLSPAANRIKQKLIMLIYLIFM